MSRTLEIPLARIGNSRGIRLPAPLIKKIGFERGVVLEDLGDSVVLKPLRGKSPEKLSWSETARAMSVENENWSDWDRAGADGLKDIPWDRNRSGRNLFPDETT